jgi:prevent-host-death family protein
MRQVNIHEAKTHFSELIAAVERGEEVIIARRGKQVVRLQRCSDQPDAPKRRTLGALAGVAVEVDPDWWKPVPDEEIRATFGDKYADEVGAP